MDGIEIIPLFDSYFPLRIYTHSANKTRSARKAGGGKMKETRMEHPMPHQPFNGAAAQLRAEKNALLAVSALFFLWGLLTSLNDVLIPHLREVYSLSYSQAMLIQFCFFAAYLFASSPAGLLLSRIGYQNAVVVGLLIAAAGCALFYPAASSGYLLFLSALFTLACGITILQVAANPYVAALGSEQTAARRLTLTQAFNALGTAIAPAVGGMFILTTHLLLPGELAAKSAIDQAAYRAQQAESVQGPYLVLALTLALTAAMFALIRLPKIALVHRSLNPGALKQLCTQRHFVHGAGAIFAYVGAEVSIGSFLINFIAEPNVAALPSAQSAYYVSYYWGGAMVGRFIGFLLMRSVKPAHLLVFNAGCSIALLLIGMRSDGAQAMLAVISIGLCNSIMFPTIFSMALSHLGRESGRASGLLCTAIVGGAVVPLAQGLLADRVGVQLSFVVPAFCYAYVLYFGWRFRRT
jgi:FHS family L-fucose permease-like MFS transporter